MAGSLLGPDQIRKINATFPALIAHIRTLLVTDRTAVGLMRVHLQVETFDSDEMSQMFRELSFISPKERLALVRAAIYDLMAREPALFTAPATIDIKSTVVETVLAKPEPLKVFTPAQFNLNVNKSNVEEIAKTDTKPTPPPATSTHESIVAKAVDDANKRMAEQANKLEAAVAKLRESSKPSPIEIMAVPEDANLQIEPLPNLPDDPGFVAPEE